MLNDKTTPETKSNINMDIEMDFFFQDVSIDVCKEVLQSLWEHQVNPKDNNLNAKQVLKIVKITREITKFINGVLTSYRDGEVDCLKMDHHIKPLSDNHYIETELDFLLYDYFTGAATPPFVSRGIIQCNATTDMLYHIVSIIEKAHCQWVEYVKREEALEAAESSISPVYCQPAVYK